MKIILDSNILFSAMLKNSLTRKLIIEYDDYFLFPSYIFYEFKKHKKELLKKSGMKIIEFNRLLRILLRKVVIIPNESLYPFRERALKIVKNIDINDVIFIACALAYSGSIIWSDDKKLKNQSDIKVLNTGEIKTLIEGT